MPLDIDVADPPYGSTLAEFRGTHLRWSFSRHQKPFVVRVVEPTNYEPGSHGELFNAALTAMIERPRSALDTYTETSPRSGPRQFDLITFPEAFIDGATLIAALEMFRMCGPSGCVHTGLRVRESDTARHLFQLEEIRALKAAIEEALPSAHEDLRGFSTWLDGQDSGHGFNLGCLFLNDADGETRICLHPKIVRSKFERSPFNEDSLCEANLLTLVTLEPQQAGDLRFFRSQIASGAFRGCRAVGLAYVRSHRCPVPESQRSPANKGISSLVSSAAE